MSSRLPLLLTTTSLALALSPALARADVKCEFNLNTGVASVDVTSGTTKVDVSRMPEPGQSIGFNGTVCKGAMVSNTKLVEIDDLSGGHVRYEIDEGYGPYAAGSNTVHFAIDGKTEPDYLDIIGTSGPDKWQVGSVGINLDADEPANSQDVEVTWKGLASVTLHGAGGADTISGAGGVGSGYPYADELTLDGGDGNDLLGGGAGKDELRGGAGDDKLQGAAGRDRLMGGLGDDILIGGTEEDVADYSDASTTSAGVTVDLTAGGKQDTVLAGKDQLLNVEDLTGSSGDDTLRGNDQENDLYGAKGNDTLEGRGGIDRLIGDDGDDTLLLQDGLADLGECGNGTDMTPNADAVDELSNCEAPVAPPAGGTPGDGGTPGTGGTPGDATPGSGTPQNGTPQNGTPQGGTPGKGTPGGGTPQTGGIDPGTPSDHVAPVLALAAIKGQHVSSLRRTGVRVTVVCSEACALTGGAKTASGGTAGTLAGRALGAGQPVTVTIPLSATVRRALRTRKHTVLVVSVTGRDAAGNATTQPLTVRV